MFDFEYVSPELKEKIENLFYPEEVVIELRQFLEALRKDGQVSHADYFRGNIYRISASAFELQYFPDLHRGCIKILELKVRSLDILKERFSIINSWDDSEVIEVIPQYDSPSKLIKAVKLIFRGVVDAYELGYELGHRGKKDKYIRRHGNYACQALESLRLVELQKQGRKKVPILTKQGKRLAEANDNQLQEKLLTVAMLNYHPLWRVIGAITEGEEEFDDSTIQNLVFHEADREANTCPRRTQTLKAWIRWISKTSGIPIRLPGGFKQLTIPLIYSDSGISTDH